MPRVVAQPVSKDPSIHDLLTEMKSELREFIRGELGQKPITQPDLTPGEREMSSSEEISPISIPCSKKKAKCTFKSKLLSHMSMDTNAGRYITINRCENGCNIFRNKRDYTCPGCGVEVKYSLTLPKLKYGELCELANRFKSQIE